MQATKNIYLAKCRRAAWRRELKRNFFAKLRNPFIEAVKGFYFPERNKANILLNKRCERKAEKRTVMMLVFKRKLIAALMVMNSICMRRKKVNKFLRRAAKQQQHSQHTGKKDMTDFPEQRKISLKVLANLSGISKKK